MEKRAQHVEEMLERSIDTITSHPAFLSAVSTMLNVNSYRKIWVRKTLEALWKDLELPVRREQEKLLSSIEELTMRIRRLELELQMEREKAAQPRASSTNNRRSSKQSKAEPATAELDFR